MNDASCAVLGCEKARKTGRTLCSMHAARKWRHGDVEKVHVVEPRLHSNGYVLLAEPGHPLADARGRVYLHRKVLFDMIGPEPAKCHLCGCHVYWQPGPAQAPLTVDHLDWDTTNNQIENLAPACSPCNIRRQREIRRGEALHSSVLTNEDVYEIRASSLTYVELGAIYGVHARQIGKVKRGEQWKHLLPAS